MIERNGYRKVATRKELKEGALLRVEPDGKPIVLIRVDGKVFAMDAVCSHEGGPLEEGTLEGYKLKCPWHYAIFDTRSGKVSVETDWATDLKSYPVQIDPATGDIMVNPNAAPTRGGEESVRQETGLQNKERTEEQQLETSPQLNLTLMEKEKLEGTDIMTFTFTKGEDSKILEYKAGQFAFFPLDDVNNDPKGPVRHFSIASSPTEDKIIISTRIRETLYKQKLASLEKGAKIKVSRAAGEFILHDDYSKPAIFLSGGIGVTPFRSMIKYATDKKLKAKIVMFDSNRNMQNILYKDEFDSWPHENPNLKVIYTITDEESSVWKGERGRIDKAMIDRHLSNEQVAESIFYICGPPGMLKAMQGLLQDELRIPKDRIKVEEFTGY